jgi:cytochrome c-type biogenesis protein CcmH/NrfG
MNNSRIVNELIEKANEWSYEEYNYKETGYTREQLYSQKLAELIVLECIKMVENEAEQYAQPTWAVELVNDIKENFGIEREWTQESKDWVIKNFGIEP